MPLRLSRIPRCARVLFAAALLLIPAVVQATNLNDLFHLPVWKDSNLWDDEAEGVAWRMKLKGTSNAGTEIYRNSFYGSMEVLGEPLFSLDLYCSEHKPQRVVFGFINQADLNAVGTQLAEPEFRKKRDEAMGRISAQLSERLGAPAGSGPWTWSWVGHQIQMQATSSALIVTLEKGNYVPNESEAQKMVEKDHRAFDPAERVKRRSNGDVVITGLPPISQGNRGFCVPAAWEKVLRYYGVSLNVYELAEAGGTTVNGSSFRGFAGSVSRDLSPLGFKLDYLRETADDLAGIQGYLDRGLPLVWGIDAQLLPLWVEQTGRRRDGLEASDKVVRKLTGPPGYHALLIIGYNLAKEEIALSDSTELGHSHPEIWITRKEAGLVAIPSAPLIAILPPNALTVPTRAFKKARWY
ncbi:MAG: C39 family peptidase [Candidatus Methylacidiphilales bacterium]|nr:C39 family peptidase [Candidatus Methylacidiphilales bacterium]